MLSVHLDDDDDEDSDSILDEHLSRVWRASDEPQPGQPGTTCHVHGGGGGLTVSSSSDVEAAAALCDAVRRLEQSSSSSSWSRPDSGWTNCDGGAGRTAADCHTGDIVTVACCCCCCRHCRRPHGSYSHHERSVEVDSRSFLLHLYRVYDGHSTRNFLRANFRGLGLYTLSHTKRGSTFVIITLENTFDFYNFCTAVSRKKIFTHT